MKEFNKPEWFYVHSNEPAQNGLYRLLIKKHNIPVETVVECLNIMRSTHISYIDKEPTSNTYKKYWTEKRKLRYVIDMACFEDNFDKLLKVVTEKTGIIFKRNFKNKARNTYEDWYAEASMDGSLAYNGVTDDF